MIRTLFIGFGIRVLSQENIPSVVVFFETREAPGCTLDEKLLDEVGFGDLSQRSRGRVRRGSNPRIHVLQIGSQVCV